MKLHPPSRSMTLWAAVVAALALGACNRNDERNAGPLGDTSVAGARESNHCVHVGTVAIYKGTVVMHDCANSLNLFFKNHIHQQRREQGKLRFFIFQKSKN